MLAHSMQLVNGPKTTVTPATFMAVGAITTGIALLTCAFILFFGRGRILRLWTRIRNSASTSSPRPVLRQFVMFCLVGLSGVGAGLGVLNLCMAVYPCFPAANVAAFLVAATWNFLLNRRFTFGPTDKPFLRQWFQFLIASGGGAVLNWTVSMGLYYGLTFFRRHFNYAALLGITTACAANFLLSRSYVFRNTEHVRRLSLSRRPGLCPSPPKKAPPR